MYWPKHSPDVISQQSVSSAITSSYPKSYLPSVRPQELNETTNNYIKWISVDSEPGSGDSGRYSCSSPATSVSTHTSLERSSDNASIPDEDYVMTSPHEHPLSQSNQLPLFHQHTGNPQLTSKLLAENMAGNQNVLDLTGFSAPSVLVAPENSPLLVHPVSQVKEVTSPKYIGNVPVNTVALPGLIIDTSKPPPNLKLTDTNKPSQNLCLTEKNNTLNYREKEYVHVEKGKQDHVLISQSKSQGSTSFSSPPSSHLPPDIGVDLKPVQPKLDIQDSVQQNKNMSGKLFEMLLRALNRQELTNTEMAEIVDKATNEYPEHKICEIVQHGLATIDAQYFRDLIHAPEGKEERKQLLSVSNTGLSQQGKSQVTLTEHVLGEIKGVQNGPTLMTNGNIRSQGIEHTKRKVCPLSFETNENKFVQDEISQTRNSPSISNSKYTQQHLDNNGNLSKSLQQSVSDSVTPSATNKDLTTLLSLLGGFIPPLSKPASQPSVTETFPVDGYKQTYNPSEFLTAPPDEEIEEHITYHDESGSRDIQQGNNPYSVSENSVCTEHLEGSQSPHQDVVSTSSRLSYVSVSDADDDFHEGEDMPESCSSQDDEFLRQLFEEMQRVGPKNIQDISPEILSKLATSTDQNKLLEKFAELVRNRATPIVSVNILALTAFKKFYSIRFSSHTGLMFTFFLTDIYFIL